MTKLREETISFIKTFLSTLVTTILVALGALPSEVLSSKEFWTTGGIIAVIGAAVRTALSITWKNTMPQKLGGKK